MFTGKHLYWSLFFNKVVGLQAWKYLSYRAPVDKSLFKGDDQNAEITLAFISLLFTYLYLTLVYTSGIYLFKGSNGNTKAMCEICSKLTIKTPERRVSFWCRYC